MSEVQSLPVAEADYKWPDDELVVRLSDYDALAAECERLREQHQGSESQAEYQRDRAEHFQAERDAALAELAALKGGQEAGKLQWPEIVGLVNEVLGCEAHKFPCSRGSIGHEMTGINFNSLARIIDRVRHRYTDPPAQASAWPEGWKLVPVAPTQEMLDAALRSPMHSCDPRTIVAEDYAAMLAAAPTPGASDGKGGKP